MVVAALLVLVSLLGFCAAATRNSVLLKGKPNFVLHFLYKSNQQLIFSRQKDQASFEAVASPLRICCTICFWKMYDI